MFNFPWIMNVLKFHLIKSNSSRWKIIKWMESNSFLDVLMSISYKLVPQEICMHWCIIWCNSEPNIIPWAGIRGFKELWDCMYKIVTCTCYLYIFKQDFLVICFLWAKIIFVDALFCVCVDDDLDYVFT